MISGCKEDVRASLEIIDAINDLEIASLSSELLN